MPKWDALELKQFRGLRGLKLDGLGQVNLLVGRNNCGKTSILEALAILCHPLNIWTWIDTAKLREIKLARTPLGELLRLYFPQRDDQADAAKPFYGTVEVVTIERDIPMALRASLGEFRIEPNAEVAQESAAPMALHDTSEHATMIVFQVLRGDQVINEMIRSDLDFTPLNKSFLPSCAVSLVTPVSHRTEHDTLRAISRAIESGAKPELIRLLQFFDPQVGNLEIVSPSGRGAVIKIWRKGVGFIPLSAEGDGLRRALTLATSAYEAREGILLLDELETALHTSAIEAVYRFLFEICRELRIQVFATTHSLEAIDAVVAAHGQRIDDLVLHRLPPANSATGIKRFQGAEVARMRAESGFDLR